MKNPAEIQCLIIDDEPLAQELLIDYVERIPELTLVGSAANGQQALAMSLDLKPDLLLLDIRMPRMSGFELMEALPKPVPLVIVTSAYREYALKGYEHSIIDFLEKPIYFDRFSKSIERAAERIKQIKQVNQRVESPQESGPKLLTVRSERADVFIPLDHINYIESLENYLKIHLVTRPAKNVLTKMTVSDCIARLPAKEFIRINRKYIVRVDKIHQLGSSSLILFSGEELPIGVIYRDQVREAVETKRVSGQTG